MLMRHHYIPQFYLKQWIKPENQNRRIQCYKLQAGKVISRKIAPKSTAFEHDLYSRKNVSGENIQAIEEKFFSPLDNEASKIHQQILNKGIQSITREQKLYFSVFIYYLFIRNPKHVKNIEKYSLEEQKKLLVKLEDNFKETYKIDVQYYFDNNNLSKDFFPLALNNPDFCRPIKLISDMVWIVEDYTTILKSDGISLLTSDNPVTLNKFVNSNDIFNILNHPRTYLTFPLSPAKCLFIIQSTFPNIFIYQPKPKERLKEQNREIIRKCHKYVYAMDDQQKIFIEAGLKKKVQLNEIIG